MIILSILTFLSVFPSPAHSGEDEQCRLYLAPSATSSESDPKMGLFTGVDLPPNSIIGEPDIAINLIYSKSAVPTSYESENGSRVVIPGIGLLSEMKGYLFNAETEHEQDEMEHDESLYMYGSNSEYSNVTFLSTRKIDAGDAIFLKDDENVKDETYEKAVATFNKFSDYASELGDDVGSDFKKDVWNFIMENVVENDVYEMLPGTDELDVALDRGLMQVHFDRQYGGVDWLEENGYCLDLLTAKKSTIPDAGLGAFAKTKIQKQEVVVPVPVIPMQRNDLIIYEHDDDEETDRIIGSELLWNYCLGHSDSSLLLYPVSTMMNYINHKSNRQGDDQGPNAEIWWAYDELLDANEDKWSSMSVDDIVGSNTRSPALMFQIVSTRDILPGEEVFIDYGERWENAWERFMRNWIAPEEHVSITVMNAKKNNQPFRTEEDQTDDPYPRNVMTAVFFKKTDEMSENKNGAISWKEVDDLYRDENLVPCRITEAFVYENEDGDGDKSYDYVVEVEDEDGNVIVVDDVPHDEIWFIENKQHDPAVEFRHAINIPDDVFPESWKDLESSN